MKNLGDIIEFEVCLERRRHWDNNKPYLENSRRHWGNLNIGKQKGVIIGVRTLQNGYTYTEDNINVFIPEEYFKAYLVSYNLYRSPVYIKIDADNE